MIIIIVYSQDNFRSPNVSETSQSPEDVYDNYESVNFNNDPNDESIKSKVPNPSNFINYAGNKIGEEQILQ